MIRVLIVDDEELGRTRVEQLLKEHPNIEIASQCDSGESAIDWLKSQECDLIFLDIQMPEIDGFDVVRQTPKHRLPMVVFVTAYHEYAIEAFRLHALDYLLKPVDRAQFQDTLHRAVEMLNARQQGHYLQRLTKMLEQQNQQDQFRQKCVTIKQGERIFLVQYTDIIAVEASGNYLTVQTAESRLRMRSTLSNFIHQANCFPIVQINRSVAINLEYIKEIQRYFKGEYALVMKNGSQFTTSSRYRSGIEELLK